jgi:hypothetical protein
MKKLSVFVIGSANHKDLPIASAHVVEPILLTLQQK